MERRREKEIPTRRVDYAITNVSLSATVKYLKDRRKLLPIFPVDVRSQTLFPSDTNTRFLFIVCAHTTIIDRY